MRELPWHAKIYLTGTQTKRGEEGRQGDSQDSAELDPKEIAHARQTVYTGRNFNYQPSAACSKIKPRTLDPSTPNP